MNKVFIYSTCQGDAIGKILQTSDIFNSRYEICRVIHNYEYIRSQKEIINDEEVFADLIDADVFIYQHLDDIHGNNSTNNLIKHLKKDCVKISIPYVFINSLTPFVVAYLGDIQECSYKDAQQYVIRNMAEVRRLMKTLNVKQILELYDSNLIDWDFENRHNDMMSFLRKKEKNTDVKVCDYIEENLSKKKLMIYYSHPTTDLLIYMANQICDMLGLEHIENVYEENYFLNNMRMYYPTSSVKHFKLEFVDDKERMIADRDFREKLEQYINKKK